MKTATIRELRNNYNRLLDWVDQGEEVQILKRGKAVARLVPEIAVEDKKVDWTKSAAFTMDRSKMPKITKAQYKALWEHIRGKY
jgi:prevent-host-death family protein